MNLLRAMLMLALTDVGLGEALLGSRSMSSSRAAARVLPTTRMTTTASAASAVVPKLFDLRGGADAATTTLHLQLAGKLLVSQARPQRRRRLVLDPRPSAPTAHGPSHPTPSGPRTTDHLRPRISQTCRSS